MKHQKNRIKLAWKPVQGAEGYDIFASYTNLNLPTIPAKTVTKSQAVIKAVYGKSGLRKVTKDCIQYVVRAYKTVNGQKIYVAQTHKNFTVGRGGSYSDAKKVTTARRIFTIPVGKQIELSAKVKTCDGSKQIKKTKAIKYVSSNTSVAIVNSKGKVKAVGKGSCYIYVTAVNGLTKTVLINVN